MGVFSYSPKYIEGIVGLSESAPLCFAYYYNLYENRYNMTRALMPTVQELADVRKIMADGYDPVARVTLRAGGNGFRRLQGMEERVREVLDETYYTVPARLLATLEPQDLAVPLIALLSESTRHRYGVQESDVRVLFTRLGITLRPDDFTMSQIRTSRIAELAHILESGELQRTAAVVQQYEGLPRQFVDDAVIVLWPEITEACERIRRTKEVSGAVGDGPWHDPRNVNAGDIMRKPLAYPSMAGAPDDRAWTAYPDGSPRPVTSPTDDPRVTERLYIHSLPVIAIPPAWGDTLTPVPVVTRVDPHRRILTVERDEPGTRYHTRIDMRFLAGGHNAAFNLRTLLSPTAGRYNDSERTDYGEPGRFENAADDAGKGCAIVVRVSGYQGPTTANNQLIHIPRWKHDWNRGRTHPVRWPIFRQILAQGSYGMEAGGTILPLSEVRRMDDGKLDRWWPSRPFAPGLEFVHALGDLHIQPTMDLPFDEAGRLTTYYSGGSEQMDRGLIDSQLTEERTWRHESAINPNELIARKAIRQDREGRRDVGLGLTLL